MKILFYFIIPVLLVSGCSCSKPDSQIGKKETSVVTDDSVSSQSKALTLPNPSDVMFYSWREQMTSRMDTLLKKDGKNLLLTITSAHLHDSLIIEHAPNFKSFPYTFSISVLEDGSLRFNKRLTKFDLKAIIDERFLKSGDFDTPQFVKFNRRYDQFVFDQGFCMPETDDCESCFYSLDLSGNIKLSGDYYSALQVSNNDEYVLTDKKLHAFTGKVFDFSQFHKLYAIDAKFINDSTFIVVYHSMDEYDIDNAVVYSTNGRQLMSFRYNGIVDNGITWEILLKSFEELGLFILFDHKIKNVRIFKGNNALEPMLYSLTEITRLQNKVSTDSLFLAEFRTSDPDHGHYFIYLDFSGEISGYYVEQ
jgi:hypothetical protein